jgi:adenylyltransferase/sulfurtransferase
MSLTAEEIERYARHLVLSEVGGPGQARLKAARVVVIGAGGLGSPVIQYLAAAGVGTIDVVDDDAVALSNLQRQVVHGTQDIGRPKAESAADAVRRINPHVRLVGHRARLDANNAADFVAGRDVVADGSDNAATRYLVADACCRAAVPLVSAAVNGFDGHVTTLTPHEARPDGGRWPTYRCLFPDPPPDALVDECARTGILGVVPGVVGTLQANEVLKLLLGIGEPLRGRLLLFDGRACRFEEVHYAWDPSNPLTGQPLSG